MTADRIAHPPRFRWLKRLTAAGVVLFLAMLILRLWWGHLAEQRIAAAVAAARAAGEPISDDDFNAPDPPPPADQNAVVVLKSAAAGVSLNPAQAAFVGGFDPKKPPKQADSNMMANLLSANRRSLALADKAASLPRADWGYRLAGSVYATPMPRMIGQTQLTRLLCIAADDSHLQHDDERAVGYLADLLRQADAADHSPTIIGHLLAMVVYRNACDTIDQLASNLSVDLGPSSATRSQIQKLIAELLDGTNRVRFATQGWYLQRLSILQTASGPTSVFAQIAPWPWLAWILKPMYQLDALHDVNYLSATAHALARPNFTALTPWVFAPPFSLRGFSQWQSRYAMPTTGGRVQNEFEHLLYRRVAAVELALRLYQIDHGSLPQNLESLVPAYLPMVPADPFSPTGQPLQYTGNAVGGNGQMFPIHPALPTPQ